MGVWFSISLELIFLSFAYNSGSIELFKLSLVFLALVAVFIQLGIDQLVFGRIVLITLSVVTVASAYGLYTIFFLPSVVQGIIGNNQTLVVINPARSILSILGLYVSLLIWAYTLYIYYKSPPSLKFYALLNFIGTTIFAPLTVILFGLGANDIFIATTELSSGIGMILVAISFYKAPSLLFTIPYQVYELFVISKNQGLNLYSYAWTVNEGNKTNRFLAASTIESTSMMYSEAFKSGNLREIRLKKGLLLFNDVHSNEIYFVLFTNKSSEILMAALDLFANNFSQRWISRKNLDPQSLNELIDECFDFVPIK